MSEKPTRRTFLKTSVALPSAAIAFANAGTFEPDEQQVVAWKGRWANGIPFFTGYKPQITSTTCVGQVLVCWNAALRQGEQITGRGVERSGWIAPRFTPHTFIYVNTTIGLEDIGSPQIDPLIGQHMWEALAALRIHVRKIDCHLVDYRNHIHMIDALRSRESVGIRVHKDIVKTALNSLEILPQVRDELVSERDSGKFDQFDWEVYG